MFSCFSKTTLIFLLLVSTTHAFAKNECKIVLSSGTQQSAAVRNLVQKDAYKQWLLWEQKANLHNYEKPTTTINISLVKVSEEDLHVIKTEDAPENLVNLFKANGGNILWAKHPYNTNPRVPFKDFPEETSLPVYMTSSRSLALDGTLRGFTIKLATDYPHGPNGEYQPSKVDTNDDVDSALIHSTHVKTVDGAFGSDPMLIILGEVMTISSRVSGIGMVVRDVRATDDGNYYLPAFSIPYVGREIAKISRVPFEEFFGEHYATLLGEAKARLLLRYGLQMFSPNPQNMLIQLNRNLKPTGKLVFRDISDAYLVDVVAKGLGYNKQIERDVAIKYPPQKVIRPDWSNSSWRFDEAGDKSVDSSTIQQWGQLHDQAYVNYINKNLGLNITVDPRGAPQDFLNTVYQALASDIGQVKLAQFRQRLETRELERQQTTPSNSAASF